MKHLTARNDLDLLEDWMIDLRRVGADDHTLDGLARVAALARAAVDLADTFRELVVEEKMSFNIREQEVSRTVSHTLNEVTLTARACGLLVSGDAASGLFFRRGDGLDGLFSTTLGSEARLAAYSGVDRSVSWGRGLSRGLGDVRVGGGERLVADSRGLDWGRLLRGLYRGGLLLGLGVYGGWLLFGYH